MSPDQPTCRVPAQPRAGSATACRTPSPRDPLAALTTAVDAAIAALPPTARTDALEHMLAAFAAAVAPVRSGLAELAAHDRRGVLKVAQGYLGNAFAHAAAGDVDATRSALIAARAALFHLGAGEDSAPGGDWRF